MQYEGHTLRHELKYYINCSVYHELRSRLKYILKPDPNMVKEEGYLISSLYFDDMYQSAFSEKIAGTRFRKKFRIRSYELSDKVIRLECKSKYNEYISKTGALLTREEYNKILNGNFNDLLFRKEAVCKELSCYSKTKLLRPVVVVEYLREAYIHPLGNIRITFDKNISSSVGNLDMFSKEYRTSMNLPEDIMVLEVKYDDYIPKFILETIQVGMADRCAISKYVMCMDKRRRINLI